MFQRLSLLPVFWSSAIWHFNAAKFGRLLTSSRWNARFFSSAMEVSASVVLFFIELTLLDDSPATFAISLLIELLALVAEALTSASFLKFVNGSIHGSRDLTVGVCCRSACH
jgi:hypothetical protein